jgi:class 3 adenylate cyclase/tetratricopeptide (TPR) repeat protein
VNLFDIVREVRRHLEENGRLSLRMLRRQFELDDDALEEVIEELVDVQGVARRDGKVLAWAGAGSPSAATAATERSQRDETRERVHAEIAQPASALAGERKIVTIVFADLAGSTALQERLDAESARVFMQRYYEAMRTAVAAHGGTVAKLLGDGVLAVFGTPRVAEDDAPRAVHAAFEMHRAFRELAEEHTALVGAIGLRVAVNTGEVIASGDAEIVGDPVNVAARLQEQCGNGEVVVGEATHRLVSQLVTLTPLGSLALKGRAGAVKAYRVEALERPSGVIQAQFVGRDDEIARMTAVFENAVSTPATALTVLLGSPGLGKSRLIDEFSDRLADTAHVVSAHCDEASSATFAPLVLALRELLEIDSSASAEDARAAIEAAIPGEDAERARIAKGIAALFTGSPTSPEETFFVVRRFFAALATVRPVILVIDDLQWAEPMLLDLIEHLVEWGSKVPMLVLVGARPELRAKRSSLVSPGGFVADVVTLAGLDAGAAMRLAANVIGASDLPAAVAAKVLATSEGNPLFVGELVRMLVREGALTKEGDRWTTGTALAALEMPPTIHALLAARIARLQPVERIVLEHAAVVGRHFSRSAVAELLPRDVADLDTHLESLQRSELIERDTGWFLGEPVLRFHHVLIRDAAYRQLLKGSRAELHSRFADWVQDRAGDSVDHDETIGWHLEQAHILLGELGPIDANGRAIGERASKHLAAAGRRALAGDDVSLAASLLGRAIKRLDAKDTARSELALDWCEALLAAGDVATAMEAIDQLDRVVGDSDRLRAWHTCFAGQHTVLTAPEGLEHTASAVAAAAESLASQGDPPGEAKAHFVHALALASLGRIGACEAALDRALAAARRVAGDRRRANTVLAVAPLAALWGPSPVTRASGRCLDVVRVLRITQGAPAVEAVALSCQGVLEALRGRTDAARRMIASSREMVEELGITQRLLEVDVSSGLVDLLEGDAVSAERSLRHAYEGMCELGLGIDAARAAALLARALLALGQATEAEELSHQSEALAGDDLKAAIAWRGVRAEALARRGEHAAAVEFANKAVEIAAATDALLDHADARLALAAALRAAGRGRDADAEEHRAHELWEAKGASVLAERARSDAALVPPVTAAAQESIPTAPASERTVRANAATATTERLEAKVAAHELAELPSMFTEGYQEIDHPTGSAFGRDAMLSSLCSLLRSEDPCFDLDPLASLGASLALVRRRSGARGTHGGRYDVGAYETEAIHVIEVDENGRFMCMEVFAADRLDEAIACLHERHAALLPEGPLHAQAAMAARSLSYMLLGPSDLDLAESVLAADFASIDHRPLSTWSLCGVDAWIDHMRALLKVADAIDLRSNDILALEPNALLVRRLHSGKERVGGGDYERAFYVLGVTNDDGRLARAEWFTEDQGAQALARFDELTEGASSCEVSAAGTSAPRPHVRPNAASELIGRLVHALAAGDLVGMRALFSDSHVEIDRPTGSTFGPDASVASVRRFLRSRAPFYEMEPIATLGETFVLTRRRWGAAGAVSTNCDVGPYHNEVLHACELDQGGLLGHSEIFAVQNLNDAVVWLYERYAQNLPEGSARDRAAAVARSAAAWTGPIDLDRLAATIAPFAPLVDHRVLATWTSRDSAELLQHFRLQLEFAPDFGPCVDDVLALTPNAFLLRNTYHGTGRDSGGPFEDRLFVLFVCGTDGRVSRIEAFEAEAEAEALARFDQLTIHPAQSYLAERRIESNLATAICARHDAALAAHDADAIAAELSPGFEYRHHSTGVSYGADGYVAQWRMAFGAERFDRVAAHIGTVGEKLVIGRETINLAGLNGKDMDQFGPTDLADFYVLEANEGGLCERVEIFDRARAANALTHIYERHAELLPVGAERDRATITARVFAEILGTQPDPDRFAALITPEIELVDHRTLGFGSVRGIDGMYRYIRAFVEQEDAVVHVDDIFALRPDTALIRTVTVGTSRTSGGAYERPMLQLWTFADDGRLHRMEQFDSENEAEALARYDELVGRDSRIVPGQRFANAATRLNEKVLRAWRAHDWAAIEALHAPGATEDDRRRLVGIGATPGGMLTTLRFLFDTPNSSMVITPIATRGERLALSRAVFRGTVDADGGELAIDYLIVDEVDADGLSLHVVVLDSDDIDAAYIELDARYNVGEVADNLRAWKTLSGFMRAIQSRDWEALLALASPELVEFDRRGLSILGTTRGAEAWVKVCRSTFDLAPDTTYRVHHFRPAGRGAYTVGGWYGARDGSNYEIPLTSVIELDERGLIVRTDLYDVGDPAALARLAELSGPVASVPSLSNAATRAAAMTIGAWLDKDWDRFAARFPANFHGSDRRRGVLLELGRDEMIAFSRSLGETATTRIIDSEPLALRGQRLALMRWRIELAGDDTAADDVGPAELVHLNLFELDEDGALVSVTRWDDDDLAAALAELDARAAAIGEPVVGTGGLPTRTVEPPAATAWRRPGDSLAEITRSNAAAIATHRFQVAYDVFADTGDDRQVRSICAPRHAYEDRRRMALLSGDVELMLASVRERAAIGARLEYRLAGTAGDRIAMGTALWSGGPPDGRFEIEYFVVVEVDEAGLISAFVLMDLDDPRAVQREAWARWAAIDPDVPGVVTPIGEAVDAFNEQDAAGFRAAHTGDLVVDDHRLAGVGRIEGADAYTESIVALWELAPITQVSNGWLWPAFAPCGGVTVLRRTGTLADGGDFESEYLFLFLVELGRFAHIELFELHALDKALARFEELTDRDDSVSTVFEQGDVKPNAASEATAHWHDTFVACVASGDWEPLRAEYPEDAIFEDRQRHSLVSGDRGVGLASARERAAAGARPKTRLLATVGERIAITRMLWSGGPADGRFEVEHLTVSQVDASGRIAATILFDVDDMRAARRAAWERWAAIEPAVAPHLELLTKLSDAWNSQDTAFGGAPIADDIVVEDHRLAGIGRVEGADAYRRANEVLWDLAPNQRIECGPSLCAYGPHGMLVTLRRYGTLPDGGDFESVYLQMFIVDDGRVTRLEMFETDALDEALARFEELRPNPLRVPPNDATLALQGLRTAEGADALRALVSEDFVFDDRRKHSLVVGGIEDWIRSREFLTSEASARVDVRLLAAPGRSCALLHACWSGGPSDGRFEIEHLVLVEVDASGLFTAFMLFEPDDRAAAHEELTRRYLDKGVDGAPQGAVDFWSGLNEHDLVRARSGLVDDFVLSDHRRTGMGVVDGADAYIASVRALYELSSDVTVQPLWTAARGAHGRVEVLRRTGTNSEGGEFEGIFISLSLNRGQQLAAFEYFEPEDLGRALARFEELRPDPLRIPPNEVERTLGRSRSITDADALRAVVSDDFVFDDRKKHSHSVGSVEDWIRSLSFLRDEARAEPVRRLIATAGDRIALYQMLWSGGPSDGRFEIEHFFMGEVDEAGRFNAVVLFDPEDRAAADAELFERYVAAGANGMSRGALEFLRGFNAHDLVRARRGLTDDFVLDDRRRTGMGLVEGADSYLASIEAIYELIPDVRTDFVYFAAQADHGSVCLMRRVGHNTEGGAVKSQYLVLTLDRDDKLARMEFYEPEQLFEALARFEGLRPQSADSRESA